MDVLKDSAVRTPKSVKGEEDLGRIRLSKNFCLREFLYSEIANIHGQTNLPENLDLAIEVGKKLCTELLEPLKDAVRSHLHPLWISVASKPLAKHLLIDEGLFELEIDQRLVDVVDHHAGFAEAPLVLVAKLFHIRLYLLLAAPSEERTPIAREQTATGVYRFDAGREGWKVARSSGRRHKHTLTRIPSRSMMRSNPRK
jgi:hypothetical protein